MHDNKIQLSLFFHICVCTYKYLYKQNPENSVSEKRKNAVWAPSQYKGVSKAQSITACGVCHRTTCCYWKNAIYLAEKWWDEVAIKNSRIVLFTFMPGHILFFFFFFPLCECTENAHSMVLTVLILVSSACPLITLSIFQILFLGEYF